MDEEKVMMIVNNPDAVDNIIYHLRQAFPRIFRRHNHAPRDPYSFFLYGHCLTFARILYEIFDGHVNFLVSPGHVVTVIGKDIFDINGCLNPATLDIDKYSERSYEDLNLVAGALWRPDDHDEEIKNDLIEIGKARLEEKIKEKEMQNIDSETLSSGGKSM